MGDVLDDWFGLEGDVFGDVGGYLLGGLINPAMFLGTAAAAAPAAGSIYQGLQAKKQTKLIEEGVREQEKEYERLKAEEQKGRDQVAMRNYRRRAAAGAGDGGKLRTNILTGPMGVLGQPATANKELLGQ